jgi:hypothetical protein
VSVPDDRFFAIKNETVMAKREPVQLSLFAAIDERFAEKPRKRPRMFPTKSAQPRRRSARAWGITKRIS